MIISAENVYIVPICIIAEACQYFPHVCFWYLPWGVYREILSLGQCFSIPGEEVMPYHNGNYHHVIVVWIVHRGWLELRQDTGEGNGVFSHWPEHLPRRTMLCISSNTYPAYQPPIYILFVLYYISVWMWIRVFSQKIKSTSSELFHNPLQGHSLLLNFLTKRSTFKSWDSFSSTVSLQKSMRFLCNIQHEMIALEISPFLKTHLITQPLSSKTSSLVSLSSLVSWGSLVTHVGATLESPTQPPSTSQQEEVSCAGMGGGGGGWMGALRLRLYLASWWQCRRARGRCSMCRWAPPPRSATEEQMDCL